MKAKAARWSISKTGKSSVSLRDESTDITVHTQPPTLTHFSRGGGMSNCHLMTKIKLEVPEYEELKLTH